MHGHEAGGVNAGAVVLALPLIVLGVILFFQKTAGPAVSAVLVAGGLIVAVGGFTFLRSEGETHQHRQETGSDSEYQDAVAALCEARDAQPDEARALFFDRAHGPLHVLADEVADQDRGTAADLLEAKQEVESMLDSEAGADLNRSFGRLVDATVAAVGVLDVEVEACA